MAFAGVALLFRLPENATRVLSENTHIMQTVIALQKVTVGQVTAIGILTPAPVVMPLAATHPTNHGLVTAKPPEESGTAALVTALTTTINTIQTAAVIAGPTVPTTTHAPATMIRPSVSIKALTVALRVAGTTTDCEAAVNIES